MLRGWFHLVGSLAMLVAGPLIGLEASERDQGRAVRRCRLFRGLGDADNERPLPQGALVRCCPTPHATRRPLDDLCCHRRHLHRRRRPLLPDTDAEIVLGLVWGACIIGIVMRFVWLEAPRWAVAVPYIAAGWIAVGAMPEFFHCLGVEGFSLMMAGGLVYTAGAVVYALKRPDPWPKVFGFHEVFHACVVVAAAIHLSLIAFVVLPALNS